MYSTSYLLIAPIVFFMSWFKSIKSLFNEFHSSGEHLPKLYLVEEKKNVFSMSQFEGYTANTYYPSTAKVQTKDSNLIWITVNGSTLPMTPMTTASKCSSKKLHLFTPLIAAYSSYSGSNMPKNVIIATFSCDRNLKSL